MGDEVANIDDYRPHRAGQAVCHECGYESVIVAPVSADSRWKECGECGQMRSQFIGKETPNTGDE